MGYPRAFFVFQKQQNELSVSLINYLPFKYVY